MLRAHDFLKKPQILGFQGCTFSLTPLAFNTQRVQIHASKLLITHKSNDTECAVIELSSMICVDNLEQKYRNATFVMITSLM